MKKIYINFLNIVERERIETLSLWMWPHALGFAVKGKSWCPQRLVVKWGNATQVLSGKGNNNGKKQKYAATELIFETV